MSLDKPSLRAVPMTLFPSADTLEEAINRANARLPINTPNELYGVLMLYQNTLLKVIHGEQRQSQ